MDPVKPAALRDNADKPQLDYVLMFPKAMEALARVCEAGGRKYCKGNFRLGGKPDDEYYGCAMRHIMKAHNGEPHDLESGGLHLAHAAWNILALIELNHEGPLYCPGLDKTRPKNK